MPVNPGDRYPTLSRAQQAQKVVSDNQFVFGFLAGQITLTLVWIAFRVFVL